VTLGHCIQCKLHWLLPSKPRISIAQWTLRTGRRNLQGVSNQAEVKLNEKTVGSKIRFCMYSLSIRRVSLRRLVSFTKSKTSYTNIIRYRTYIFYTQWRFLLCPGLWHSVVWVHKYFRETRYGQSQAKLVKRMNKDEYRVTAHTIKGSILAI
jgi:hypothetical protein